MPRGRAKNDGCGGQHDETDNVLYINFEGLSVETLEEAQKPADFFDRKLASFGKQVNSM